MALSKIVFYRRRPNREPLLCRIQIIDLILLAGSVKEGCREQDVCFAFIVIIIFIADFSKLN